MFSENGVGEGRIALHLLPRVTASSPPSIGLSMSAIRSLRMVHVHLLYQLREVHGWRPRLARLIAGYRRSGHSDRIRQWFCSQLQRTTMPDAVLRHPGVFSVLGQ